MSMFLIGSTLLNDARYNSMLDSHKDFYIRMMAVFNKDTQYPLELLEPDTMRKLLYPAPDRFDGKQNMLDCISTAIKQLELRGFIICYPDVYDEHYPELSQKGYFKVFEPGTNGFPTLDQLTKDYVPF